MYTFLHQVANYEILDLSY